MKKEPAQSLRERIRVYRNADCRGAVVATSMVAWTFAATPSAQAVVNTFTFPSPPGANSWDRLGGPVLSTGPDGSLFRGNNLFVKVRVDAIDDSQDAEWELQFAGDGDVASWIGTKEFINNKGVMAKAINLLTRPTKKQFGYE